jgi:uncharacterized membrane protein YeaQ/YmgE (transglycosylase-associated protein family)
MFNFIVTVITGLVVGILARFFYPGPVPMNWLWTILLGVGGSVLAGFVTSRGRAGFHRAGFIASVLGAMALIFIGRLLNLG